MKTTEFTNLFFVLLGQEKYNDKEIISETEVDFEQDLQLYKVDTDPRFVVNF